MTGVEFNKQQKIIRGSLPLVLDGTFKPWAIEVGHSKLLLRGLIGDPEDTTPLRVVDVLFQDVSRICLNDRYCGIELRVAAVEERKSEIRRIGINLQKFNMYLIKHGAVTDYVVAGRVFWADVAIHPGARSPLLAEVATLESVPLVHWFE